MTADWDRLVEQLAFGGGDDKRDACLGLYLSQEAVFVAETRKDSSGRLRVEHLLRIPMPADGRSPLATATMSGDFLSDAQRVAGPVRQSMAQVRWGTKNVRVALSHHLGLLRFFPMPMVERRYLRTAVPLEAKKYIPLPFSALAYDWQAVPLPPDAARKPRQGVLVSVTQKKNLASVQALVEALGLKLSGLEVAPCAVLRMWEAVAPAKPGESYAQVHFDGGTVRVMVCDRGLPVFFRELFLGTEATMADQRKVDLPGCMAFVQKQLGLPRLARLKVCGTLPPAALAQWQEALSKEAGVPGEVFDHARALSVRGSDWGGFAAMGASAKDLGESPILLDLAAVNRVSHEERQAARDILLAGAAAAGFFALGGLYLGAQGGYRARELGRYAVDPAAKAALNGRPTGEVEQRLAEMRGQLQQLRGTADRSRAPLSAILREVVAAMPDAVWVRELQASEPLFSPTGGGGLDLTLKAGARGATGAEEQELARRFQDALRASPLIKKLFDAQLSIEQGAGEGPAAPDERTKFTILLRSRREGA